MRGGATAPTALSGTYWDDRLPTMAEEAPLVDALCVDERRALGRLFMALMVMASKDGDDRAAMSFKDILEGAPSLPKGFDHALVFLSD